MIKFLAVSPIAAAFLFGQSALAQPPARAANLIGSIGVNTHFDTGADGYQNTSTAESNLEYLGIGIMRDSPQVSTDETLWPSIAAATGMKFDAYIAETGPSGMAQDLSYMTSLAQSGALMAIEGGDEEDDSYPDGLGNTLSITAAFQQNQVWPLGRSLGLPVINMSFGSGYTSNNAYIGDYGVVGDLSAWCNYSVSHTYPTSSQNPYFGLADVNTLAHMSALSNPVAITEVGWNTSSVSTTLQAQYVIDAVFDAYLLGDPYVMFYALYDDGSGDYGLYTEATPPVARPAATALHNLTTILADTGATAKSFHVAPPGYTIVGQQAGDMVAVVETSAGAYFIAVWDENEVVTHTVKIVFSGTVPTVSFFDPTASSSASSTQSSVSSVTMTVQAYPTLVETSANAALPALPPSPAGPILTPVTAVGTSTSTANPLGPMPVSDLAEQGLTGNLTIHLTATGTFTISSAAGSVSGSGTASLTDTATWAEFAHDLGSIVYTSPASGTEDQIVITLTDQASAANTFTIPVTIPAPYNYAVLAAPSTLAAVTNVQMALTPVNITDYTALIVPTSQVFNITSLHGILNVPVSLCGGAQVSNDGSTGLTITGTTNQMNQCVQYLTYQAIVGTSSDTVTIQYVSQYGQNVVVTVAVTVST